MNFLEDKILADGQVFEGNVMKIDNFLNHQVDVSIIRKIAEDIKNHFEKVEVTKILTIESSGIPIATILAELYSVPMVFAKKSQTVNSTDEQYLSRAYSFTHKTTNNVYVSRPYIHRSDKVLIVDDFLADGEAIRALIDIVHQAGAEVAGIGIAVEKGMHHTGERLRADGYRLHSVAVIQSMDPTTQTITFQ